MKHFIMNLIYNVCRFTVEGWPGFGMQPHARSGDVALDLVFSMLLFWPLKLLSFKCLNPGLVYRFMLAYQLHAAAGFRLDSCNLQLEYYDSVMDMCQSCQALCDRGEYARRQCRKRCPGKGPSDTFPLHPIWNTFQIALTTSPPNGNMMKK